MRLLINATPIAPGGGMTVLLGLLQGWREIDWDAHITVLCGRQIVADAVTQTGLADSVEPVLIGAGPLRRFWWQQRSMGATISRLKSDVVLTTNYYLSGIPCPQVVHHQNLYMFAYDRWLDYARRLPKEVLIQGLKARQALEKAAVNVFISDYLRRRAEVIRPESKPRNYVVYNGLGREYFGLQGLRPASERGWQLCAVQSLCRHKGCDALFGAFSTICRQSPGRAWKLVVAGGGKWDAWKAYVRQQGLEDRVEFLGHVDGRLLPDLYAKSRCLIFPSWMEGFGLPILEAMACDCPVVACGDTAIPEVAGGCALLAPAGDGAAFARHVLTLANDSELERRLVEDGHRRAQLFPWSQSADRMKRILVAVANGLTPDVAREDERVALTHRRS